MLKITLFYNQGPHGFTETWYSAGETPPYDMTPPVKALCQAAIAFRSALTTLEWIRFSVIGKPQLVNAFRMSDQVQSMVLSSESPDVVSTDAIWRIVTENFTRRTILLRGLPDGSVVRDANSGAFKPSANLVAGVNNYLNQVYKINWKVQYAENAKNSVIQRTSVLTVTPTPVTPTQTTFTIAPGYVLVPPLASGVRFTGHLPDKKIPGWPRQSQLVAYDQPSGVGQIVYTAPNDLGLYKPGKLYVQPLVYAYQNLRDWQFQSLSSRQTGRPFGALRGKRSAVFQRG